jgi:hypothetical protein
MMATYDTIPLSWNDPSLNGATSSGSVTLQNGGTLSNKSITDTGSTASVVGRGSFTLDHVRIDSREGVRIGGSGDINISNSYLEATGQGSDHADTIQAYAPGGTGNVTVTNTTIVAHNAAATAGFFVADDYAGNFTFNNVVFQGGPYGLRIHADERDITLSLKDVYFVGPFQYDPLYLLEVNGDIRITQWENVRYATIVNGELVPGDLISPPMPVEGGGGGTGPIATTIDDFSNDSGTDGDGVTNDNTLTLTGDAAANSTVKVFDGTTQIGTATANSNGAWSYTTAALSEGNHSLKAQVGTGAASSALAVQIDTKAPTAPTIATPTSNANGSLTLTGTAEAGSVVKVFDGTTQIGTATANNSGAWGYTTNTLAAGSHSLTAKATDKAGNTGAASATVTASTGTGTTPPATTPTIASFSNDSGVAGDKVTNDSTLTLAGTAAANSSVKVFDGTTQIGTATANSSGTWSYTTAALTDGNHSLTAKVANSNGGTTSSSALSVTIDTTAPTAPKIGSYTGADTASATAATDDVTLTGTAEANSTVKLFDGTTQIGSTKAGAAGAWSYTAADLAAGSHSITSKAMDAAGNTSASSAAVNVNVDADTQAPTAAFTNAWQKSNDKVVFKGTADPYSQITIYDNGGSKAIATAKAGGDGNWSLTTPSAVSDSAVHRFTATVTDSSGQTGSGSGSVVMGTNGDNRLTSTTGDDLLKGNGGHDTFAFAPNFGNDVVSDFGAGRRGSDVVQFSKSVFDDFANVMAHASQQGQHVVIDDHAGNTLTLKNTSMSSLDRSDFHFV